MSSAIDEINDLRAEVDRLLRALAMIRLRTRERDEAIRLLRQGQTAVKWSSRTQDRPAAIEMWSRKVGAFLALRAAQEGQ